ncbi:DUF859 family phage minor structural protein [Lacticaseibacillus daqingensis]|uniref:DUF859 family phage minor structural protein n=1 Tax=Lacticaseibacillus daqingensis TaxID=2486014 RepID=UPI000F7B24ED|nr:DUF859 family phage minor structural protein [Lacticaseibacillus daqingensis]
MALSGSYSYAVTASDTIVVDWSATQNIAANQSKVTVHVNLVRGSYGRIDAHNAQADLWITGGHWTNASAVIGGGNNTTTLLIAVDQTINHNADGTASFTIGFTQVFNIKFSGRYIGTVNPGDRTFTLNTIPRASSFSSISNITLGQNITVNIANHANFSHNIEMKLNGTTIQGWQGLGGGVNTLTLNDVATNALTAALANTTSVPISWIMSTNSGSTMIGGIASSNSTVSLPASELTPTVGTLTIAEANATAAKQFKAGSYIQGISQLKFTVSGSSATHGATIKTTAISFEGSNYENGATSSAISTSGAVKATATVTDSRGVQASTSVTINVTAYQAPQITTAIAMRSNANGGFVSDGQYCTVIYKASSTNLPLANGKNAVKVAIDSQLANASNWTNIETIPYTGTSAEDTKVLGSDYDGTKQYNVRLVVTDAVGGSTQVVVTLDVAHVLMSWGKTQVGIGKVAQHGTLDILGDTYMDGELNVNGKISLAGPLEMQGQLSLSSQDGETTYTGVLTAQLLEQLDNTEKKAWEGGIYPWHSDKAIMSIPLSKTLTGWLLVWDYYKGGIGQNDKYNYTILPKAARQLPVGRIDVPLGMNNVGNMVKVLWFSDTNIEGDDKNGTDLNAQAILCRVFAI